MEEGHHSGAHWRKDEILSLIAIWREDKIFEETKSTVDKKRWCTPPYQKNFKKLVFSEMRNRFETRSVP